MSISRLRRAAILPFLATTLLASVPAVLPQAAAAQTAAAPTPRAADKRPNVIVILADDFGVEGVNAYGGEYYTPNIDRLAAEGIRFQNAHATPLCSPSRVRLMTGQENARNYEAFGYLAPGQRTFGNLMQEAGYATAMVGKWQLMGNGFDGRVGITPEAAGFDESYLWQLQALAAKGSRYWGPTRATSGKSKINEEGFGPDFDSKYALDFISRHKDKPFFLYYSMVLTHDPYVPTPISMTAEGSKDRFSGMVSYMDQLVGDLMAKLKAEGLDRNTIVIFTGDNGTGRKITSMRNGHTIHGGKGLPTVNGTHVPMIVWGPGLVPEGKTSEALFDFTDVLPTLAEVAKVPDKTGKVDGMSQWPVITGNAASVRDSIFMHYAPAWQFEPTRFVFDARWKLYGDGKFVSIDPDAGIESEIDPKAAKGEAAKRLATFRRVLAQAGDGPLDPTRYPWCAKFPSVTPGVPATIAGCGRTPAGEE